jgi:hypothetical protein
LRSEAELFVRLYIGLLHYPVYNKNYKTIASAITNTDLHDLGRLARTYGVKKFFVITPLKDQQELAERILKHWTTGHGAIYNHHRKEALALIAISPSLEETIREISEMEGKKPLTIATDAQKRKTGSLTYRKAVEIIDDENVVMVIFGTAWGLDKEVVDQADFVLDPVEGGTDYNHLSVRTAAAIILDRLVGRNPGTIG